MSTTPASREAIEEAARLIRDGALVAFPTETVYGLGADATNARAVAAIFAAKGRPSFNPLIVHVADQQQGERLGAFTPIARSLAAAFWPGPLSIVVPRAEGCPVAELATAGLASIALRCPSHPVAQALISSSDRPIAAPSANVSGGVSPTAARHVEADLGDRVAMILDGGPALVGLESTVVDACGDRAMLLRPGSITREQLIAVVGPLAEPQETEAGRPTSPGQLASHYAPRARVVIGLDGVRPGDGMLSFGSSSRPAGVLVENLSAAGDTIEAAANLYAALRRLDAAGVPTIHVAQVPEVGLGEAIMDRLRRAAAPR